MGQPVSDEVWARLDPGAGRLSRRTSARMWLAAFLAVALTCLGVLVWRTGLCVPQLRWPNGWSWTASEDGPLVTFAVQVRNDGNFPVTINGAGASGPGLEWVGMEGSFPAVLPPHAELELRMVYRITDCALVSTGVWPVPVRVARPWGEMTIDLRTEHPGGAAWQAMLTEPWCDQVR